MARNTWTIGGVLLAMILGMALPAAGSVLEGSYWYTVDHITRVEKDGRILLWVTLPPDRPEQSVKITKIVPEPVAILEDEVTGNRIIEWVVKPVEEYESTRFATHGTLSDTQEGSI